MFKEGDKVTYIGPNYSKDSRRAICASDSYDIHGHTMINIEFEEDVPVFKNKFNEDPPWHVANILNLEHRTY